MDMENKTVEAKLVPILREGIDVIKMVLYMALKPVLTRKYTEMDADRISRLAGAAVNSLFGIQNMAQPFMAFEKENRKIIQEVLKDIPTTCDHLRIPLTDALRMQFLCDSQEGINCESILDKAKALNILILERDVPMPGAFMSIVRSFGVAYKILAPLPKPDPDTPESN